MESYRRNELPETVKRYKTYTNQFQQWLIKTALARNVEWAAHIAEQAKKRKGKKKYNISTEEQEILVGGIAETNAPLRDTSGLLDLGDAIRTRKEITQYHRINQSSDKGHEDFIGALDGFMAILRALVPAIIKAQDLEDESSNFIVVQFPPNDIDKDDEYKYAEEPQEPLSPQEPGQDGNNAEPPKMKSSGNPLTNEEQLLQQDFVVLRFLFAFARIRLAVCDVWQFYRDGSVNAITAALVTDLAQSHVQQNVAALVEELEIPQGQLSVVVFNLYEKLLDICEAEQRTSSGPQLSEGVLEHLLCADAISSIEMSFAARFVDTNNPQVQKDLQLKRPTMLFLAFFETIREKKIKLPIWDKFTEEMLLRPKSSKNWLPFGFQIVLDIQGLMEDDFLCNFFNDLTEHAMDIAKLIRLHVDYEDYMWAIGKKPNYMAKEVVKFSSVFLEPLDSLLTWLQNLLEAEETAKETDEKLKITTDCFVTIHTTLAGLTMWHFNKLYHSTAINKVQWFVTCLAHLYNAARQVGGLELAWPDLDFILDMHGSERIFLGDPPVDPNDFLERFHLASCISSRMMASDYRNHGKYAPPAPRETRKKRGLMPHFPLEEKIKNYYGPNPKNDRWVKRHAIFNHLHQLKKDSKDPSAEESEDAVKHLKELQEKFTKMAKMMSPPKSKNRRKKSPRMPAPDFAQTDDEYPGLLNIMRTELQSHELHSNFDFLSFFRRTFDLVLKMRSEVLYDNSMAVARQTDVHQNPEPDSHHLVIELFRALKIAPKDEKAETSGDEVSKDVVPVEQLKRITQMMGEYIREQGDAELERAKMRLNCDWDDLHASYAAEEAGRDEFEPASETQDFSHDDVEHTESEESDSCRDVIHTDEERTVVDSPVIDALPKYIATVKHDTNGVSAELPNCTHTADSSEEGGYDYLLPYLDNGPEFNVPIDFDTDIALYYANDACNMGFGDNGHGLGAGKRLHQPYVTIEDEVGIWAADLESHLDSIRRETDGPNRPSG